MTLEQVEFELKKIRSLVSDPEAATGVEKALHKAVAKKGVSADVRTLAKSSKDIDFVRSSRHFTPKAA